MSTDIIFDKTLDLAPGHVEEVQPGIRRLIAPNPGPFTFTGTVTYIVGRGRVAVIDPGPDNAEHVAAILAATAGETVSHILVTHTHRDHSPAAAALKLATGAPTYGEGPHRAARPLHVGEARRPDGGGDQSFRPDHFVSEGEIVTSEAGATDGWALEAVMTPGHTANHVAYALRGSDVLFSGDHVMGWSTTIVAPPDGSMRDYMQSLAKLQARPERIYYPGHGPAVRDAPNYLAQLVRHRHGREAAILHRLQKGEADIPTLVRALYIGLDPRLTGAAGLSVLAHLEDMVARGLAETAGEPSIGGLYRAAGGTSLAT